MGIYGSTYTKEDMCLTKLKRKNKEQAEAGYSFIEFLKYIMV